MSKIDLTFHELCADIKANGREYENKNRGVKRLQIPSFTFRHSFADGFPAITNKKLYWKGIVAELIWFLRGDNDVKFLNENGVKIWNKDAFNWFNKQRIAAGFAAADPMNFYQFEKDGVGSVGQNYSVQWRNFNGNTDQIDDLIKGMKNDIMSSRLKVNAWNPSEIFDTALPPCHSEFQVIGVPLTHRERSRIYIEKFNHKGIKNFVPKAILNKHKIPEFGFELHWNQRSVDTFLGLPFNIASYGLLAKVLEHLTGFKALGIEGTLKCVHFYDNQYDAVDELLSRNPESHKNCEVQLPKIVEADSDSIDTVFNEYRVDDFKLIGYSSDESIKVDMLAPKEC